MYIHVQHMPTPLVSDTFTAAETLRPTIRARDLLLLLVLDSSVIFKLCFLLV